MLDIPRSAPGVVAAPGDKPEVFVAAAQTKFDPRGRLTDETARTLIRQLLEALAGWTRRLRGPR